MFVSFYGGVAGLAHISQLGLPDAVPGKAPPKPADFFKVGGGAQLGGAQFTWHAFWWWASSIRQPCFG